MYNLIYNYKNTYHLQYIYNKYTIKRSNTIIHTRMTHIDNYTRIDKLKIISYNVKSNQIIIGIHHFNIIICMNLYGCLVVF